MKKVISGCLTFTFLICMIQNVNAHRYYENNGFESEEKLVEVHKDTEIPRIDTPIIENITARGFIIRVSAGAVTHQK